MTDLRQAAQAVLNAWNDGEGMFEFSLVIEDLDKALEQPEQGPVAWQYKIVEAGVFVSDQHPPDVEVWNDIEWSKPLYTTPPAAQRPWVGLTEGERNDLEDYLKRTIGKSELDAIEAKLKEKNT